MSYDDGILYDSGRVDPEDKREVEGEWVEGYDEYEGFEEFDEDGIRYLGGYQDSRKSNRWLGSNREPERRRDVEEEDEY